MDKNFRIIIFFALILALSFVAPASAATWSVDASGDADFTGIQDAINNASDGDTILVYSGVYYEKVVVDKSVTLKGIDYPVVNARGGGSAVTLTADGITVEGFNVTNSGDLWNTAGIRVFSKNNNITGNNVYRNRYGIMLYDSSNNALTGNNASNNVFGIALSSSGNNTITGNDASNNVAEGINLHYSSNNSIIGNNVGNNKKGIALSSSCNNTITDNTVCSNNYRGIYLSSSCNNTITSNTFVSDTLSIDSSYRNTVENNIVDGKPLVYLEDVSNYEVEDAGLIILVHCDNITVKNQDLSNTTTGIELLGTVDCTISNNCVSNNKCGIRFKSSSNNVITSNKVSNNDDGIYFESSCSNTIAGNKICNNSNGIYLYDYKSIYHYNSNNSITGNTVSNNRVGIRIESSSNNTITGNNVRNNTEEGIALRRSSNCTLRLNNVSTNRIGICIASSSSNNAITGNTFVNDGLFISSSYQNMVENNTVNGKPLTYLEDASDTKVADAGQIILVNCNNITVENQDLSNTSVGVALLKTEYSIISNNIMSNNSRKGIYLSSSSNNTIIGNTANNKVYIYLCDSINNVFYCNNFIINNTDIFTDRVMAIKKAIVEELKEAIEKLIEEEAEEVGTEVGKGIERPKIPLNLTSTNTWNSTKEISYIYNGSTFTNYLGNYWSDYEEKYPDAEEIDTTGIWDTPYCIDRDKDNYPLMERRELFYTLIGYCCNRNFSHLLYGYKWYRGYFNNRGQVQKFCIYEYYNFYWLFCDCWTVTYTPNSSRVLSQLSYSNMSNTR